MARTVFSISVTVHNLRGERGKLNTPIQITHYRSGAVLGGSKTCNFSVVNHIILTEDKYYYVKNQRLSKNVFSEILCAEKLVNILDVEVMGG